VRPDALTETVSGRLFLEGVQTQGYRRGPFGTAGCTNPAS